MNLHELLNEAYTLRQKRKELEKREDMVMTVIKQMTNNQPCHVGNFILEVSFRRGPVDYTQIPQLNGVNLEDYRKPDVAITSIKKV